MQSVDDPKGKTHPHHHQTQNHGRQPKKPVELTAADLARLDNIHISTRDDAGKLGSAAQTAPLGHSLMHMHPHAHLNGGRSAGHSPASANRSAGAFGPSLDFVAAQNGARLLAALAAGPGGVPQFPQAQPGLNPTGRHPAPTPLAFPGHPMGVPLGLPPMPLTPPAAAAYGFPAQLSAGHPPLYDFSALQQQHLLDIAAAQQVQAAQAAAQHHAPLSPPTNLTPGISPASRADPNALNAATLALLQQGIVPPGFYPSAFPAAANGFYPSPTDAQYGPEFVAAMARALPQYAAALAATAAVQAGQYPGIDMNAFAALNSADPNGGPSANNRKLGLYKTELCRSWEEKGTCRYGPKCQFAHGEDELKRVQRHPKYKTEICRTFWVSGSCPYGKRCCFIHTELPGPGGAGSPDGTATTPNGTAAAPASAVATSNAVNAPERTPSANSSNADGEQQQQSILVRIKAKNSDKDDTLSPSFQFGGAARPAPGGLRVDTSALDGATAVKQNKSAYPTFASNQTIPNVDSRNEAPPATAGPEFGRQRLEVLGLSKSTGSNHTRSLSGTDTTLHHARSLSGAGNLTPLAAGNTPDSATAPAPVPVPAPGSASATSHGHSRSTSGSHWGPTRGGQPPAPQLGALSAFPRNDAEPSPWAQAATAAPTGRYPNRTWAS
ncbi:hypothetical protein BKA62DRAFT_502109 [Auriculariales sp. MPI-PUGE-AT-0066]|nr:hypothetical protein BKA62DRAFT_502109 [Auriculariales sp. MPI-PUGE-AT-0066]